MPGIVFILKCANFDFILYILIFVRVRIRCDVFTFITAILGESSTQNIKKNIIKFIYFKT